MITGFRHALLDWQIIAAWIIFLSSYFVFAFGRFPGTKIDRPAMAVVGAVLMFVFRILSPRNAIDSVDFGTLVLLFSMMLIVASLHLAGFFEWVSTRVILHLTPRQLLPGSHLHQWNFVGIPGERRGLFVHGAARPRRLQANGRSTSSLPAGACYRFQYRRRGQPSPAIRRTC